jgi:hypothetical protein
MIKNSIGLSIIDSYPKEILSITMTGLLLTAISMKEDIAEEMMIQNYFMKYGK